MKAKPIFLCAVLFVAAPLWADRMDLGRAGSDNGDFSVSVGDQSSLERISSQGNSLDMSNFRPSDTAAFLSLPPGSIDLADFSTSRADEAWWKETQVCGRDGRKWGDRPPVSTPEPDSLSLLLVGLFGLGSLAWRRGRPADNDATA
jgi:hypothetical protein